MITQNSIAQYNIVAGGGGSANGTITSSSGSITKLNSGIIYNNVTSSTHSAFVINGKENDALLKIGLDGNISNDNHTVTVNEWLEVVKLMKQFIIDISQDEETAAKYPYLKEAAYRWMIEELKK